MGFYMLIKLANGKKSVTCYGIAFDEKGESNVDKEICQSLIDAGHIVEVKTEKKVKAK